jgi:hypothetical protein
LSARNNVGGFFSNSLLEFLYVHFHFHSRIVQFTAKLTSSVNTRPANAVSLLQPNTAEIDIYIRQASSTFVTISLTGSFCNLRSVISHLT